jgi:uncharacterized protein YndB with AHSA1/START domain
MTDDSVAIASMTVPLNPADAFRVFTADIGAWWHRGSDYWNDADRGLRVEIEPGIDGRILEIYDESKSDAFEIGRVTVWRPGERLVVTWRERGWEPGIQTDIDVTFEPIAAGTRVTVHHLGLGRANRSRDDYSQGWAELLGWFAAEASR